MGTGQHAGSGEVCDVDDRASKDPVEQAAWLGSSATHSLSTFKMSSRSPVVSESQSGRMSSRGDPRRIRGRADR